MRKAIPGIEVNSSGGIGEAMIERILALTRYGRLGASSRVRTLQYIPILELNGITATVSPLTEDSMLTRFYENRHRSKVAYLKVMLRRMAVLRKAREYNLLWIEKELLPFVPSWLERWLAIKRIPYVVDYDDAIYHNYDQHRRPIIRRILGKKIQRVMRSASAVFAGNEYIAEYAKQAGACRIEHVPTVVDVMRYVPILKPEAKEIRIGWIGTPNTTRYLSLLKDVLSYESIGSQLRVVLVGASAVEFNAVPTEIRAWDEKTEVQEIQNFDIGIMPLFDGPIERGKCGYKLIQYMACGLPVVASPIGVNTKIVQHGINGFLAGNTADWVNAIRTLISSSELRQRMGVSGRALVERDYSLQVVGPRLVTILKDLHRKTVFPLVSRDLPVSA